MTGKIPVNQDKMPTVMQIYKRIIRKRFPGVTFYVQRQLIQACAEECHNILMEHWRDKLIYLPEAPEPPPISMNVLLSQLKECINCYNPAVNKETGICKECGYNHNTLEIS